MSLLINVTTQKRPSLKKLVRRIIEKLKHHISDNFSHLCAWKAISAIVATGT
jgi:hypothetical protein